MTAAKKRATVGLTSSEADDLEKIKEPGSYLNTALRSLTGVTVGPPSSDAQTVHALLVAGLQAVRRKAEVIQYDQLAAFLRNDPEHRAWIESRRSRRRGAPGEAV
jgi:hypothetical protein